MNRLEELILEFSPDGVEYHRLGDIIVISRGVRVVRKQLDISGKYPVYQNSLTPLGYYDDFNCPSETTFIIGAGAAGEIGYSQVEFWAADDCFYFLGNDRVSSRYLYHFLLSRQGILLSKVRRASIPRLSRSVLEGIQIPLPPLPVQREIVRILDNFTELTAELTAELTVELTARKNQYEYYKNFLFEEVSKGEYLTLDDLCSTITDGSHFSPKAVQEGYAMPSVKDMRANGFDLTYSKRISEEDFISLVRNGCQPQQNDILVAKDGATMLKYAFVYTEQEKVVLLSSIAIFRPKENLINPQYLAHYFRQKYFRDQVIREHSTRGGVPRIILRNFKKIKIAVPPLTQQAYIVNILDKFDSLVNDISSGLPAEIEARRKQYEFYRDQLLTFQEAKA